MEKSIDIPNDLIEEILLRLPVKDLLLWKCVSKRWYVLIWDDDFVKKHYRFHYAMRLASHGDAPFLLNFPTGQLHLLSKQGERDVVMTSFPDYGTDSRVPERRVHCIGVVNGIVGLQWYHSRLSRLALWNPSTREFKDVPRWLVDDKGTEVFSPRIIGLGFDLQLKDFKILGRIYAGSYSIFKYDLYSLRANSWKRVKDTPRTYTMFDIAITDAYFDYGVWYWIAYVWDQSRPAGFVAFNFSSEIFKEVELPAPITQFHGILRIGKYKEGLAIFQNHMLDNEDKCIRIWAATRFRDDDYEVPSSWELVVKIPSINLVNDFFIKAIFDCGDLLLNIKDPEDNDGEGGNSYVAEPGTYVYHPSTRTFKYLAPEFRSSYKYMESLFPLSRRLNYINSTS